MTEVAILIPTLNRPEFVIRQLHYYIKVNSPHPVYISDASNEQNQQILEQAIQVFSSKIKIFYSYDPSLNDAQAVRKLIQITQESYCAYIGDDDFLIPDSLSQCADFLAHNSDYRTAQGRGILFHLKQSGGYGEFAGIGDYWKLPQNEEANVKERLLKFSKNYWVPLFSVHRKIEFLADFKSYLNKTDKSFSELIPNFLTITNGKSKFLNCLYLIRQGHDARYLLPSTLPWISGETWRNSYQIFLHELSNALVEQGLEQTDALSLAEESFGNYFAKVVAKHHLSEFFSEHFTRRRWYENNYLVQLKDLIKQHFPQQWPLIRKYYYQILTHIYKDTISLIALRQPTSPYYSQFSPIFDLVTSNSHHGTSS